ncbi:MAG: ribosome small subunit-dependent GTPase A [Bacteroidetes bacterium]|nr:ribosome small subunit-dependent GTPase A [Bacteroidota bacterium]
MQALIIKSTGSNYVVRHEDKCFTAKLSGKIRLDNRKSTNPIAVGDLVEIEVENEQAVIIKILPRKNYIIRKSLNLSKQVHILAANIDLAALVVTVAAPKTSTGFIDRFLVTAEAYSIAAVLVFNKSDLVDDGLKSYQQYLINLYSSIGYTCIEVSCVTKTGLGDLIKILKNKTTLLSGHSGVGKSSLINAIEPTYNLKTGAISLAHLKGTHTTTFAEIFKLHFGGNIIDSPGIKELGLVEMTKEEVGHYFPEIRKVMNECKFNNCLHQNEPKCVVIKAVEEGKISEERYINYLKILNGEEMDWTHWSN